MAIQNDPFSSSSVSPSAFGQLGLPYQPSGDIIRVRPSEVTPDVYREQGVIPPFVRTSDPLTLDPDPFGTKSDAWRTANGMPLSNGEKDGLTIFGKSFSRQQLLSTDAGQRLLDITEKNARGHKRGFLEALTDFEWSDLPFVSLFASVGKSIYDARTVANTFEKLQNGEAVSDDDLIKTRLYMAEQQYRENGSWGSTVGDIVRAAPGFMVEFFASGGLASAARTGLAAAAKGSTHLAMTRVSKIVAKEATEEVMSRNLKNAGVKVVSDIVKDKTMKKGVLDETAQRIFDTMWDASKDKAASKLYGHLTRDEAAGLARKRAEYELEKYVARNAEGKAMKNALHNAGQWAQRSLSRGLLDFGAWGTEESTRAFAKTSAGTHLAEALGALFVEAPVKGSILSLPNQFVAKPLISKALGVDPVSQAELNLKEAAYLTGNKELMGNAESIAFGINMLEYVSENTGRGFKDLFSAAGKTKFGGVLKKAPEKIYEHAGVVVPERAVKFGGQIRQWVDDVFGTRETYMRRITNEKTRLVSEAIAKKGVKVSENALDSAVRRGSVSGLDDAVKAVVGGTDDAFQGFISKTIDAAYHSNRRDLEYKSMARYMLADFMTRHNIGPQSVMNMYEKMGYDGILGEMMEERYSDVAKGMLGLDDRAEHDFWSNFKEGVKGLYPGFDQLTAEAVGFAVPMVARGVTMKMMSAVGGEGKYRELRRVLENLGILDAHPRTIQMKFGTYGKVFRDRIEELGKKVADTEAEIERARTAGDTNTEKGLTENLKQLREEIDHRKATFGKASAQMAIDELERRIGGASQDLEQAKADGNQEKVSAVEAMIADLSDRKTKIESAAEGYEGTIEQIASEMADKVVVIEPLLKQEANGMRYNLRIAPTAGQSEAGMASQAAIVDYAPELARMLFEGRSPIEGEKLGGFRWVAQKLIGIAGALTTGDLSLIAENPVQWTARDAGLSKEFCTSLRNEYSKNWELERKKIQNKRIEDVKEAKRLDGEITKAETEIEKLRSRGENTEEAEKKLVELTKARESLSVTSDSTYNITRSEVDAVAAESFAPVARRLMESYLAAHQFRSFSQNQMYDQALSLVARKEGYDDVIDGKIVKYDRDQGKFVDVADANKFYEDHKDEVDDTRDRIAYATADILENRFTGSIDARMSLQQVVRLPSFGSSHEANAIENSVVYAAAMRMSGFQGVLTSIELDENTTAGQALADHSVGRVNQDIVKYIATNAFDTEGKYDASNVDTKAFDAIAHALNYQFDGTEEDYTKRNRAIANLCRQASELDDPNAVYFSSDPGAVEYDPRLSDAASVTVRVSKNEDGSYSFNAGTKQDGTPDIRRFENLEKCKEGMSALGFLKDPVNPGVVFLHQRNLETKDPILMARSLGILRRYADLMPYDDPKATNIHPYLRKNEDGTWMFDLDSESGRAKYLDVLAEEMNAATGWNPTLGVRTKEDNRTDKQVRADYERVWGENGYMTVLEKLLRLNSVDTNEAVETRTGRFDAFSRKNYSVSLSIYRDRSGSADVYVPVDFSRGQDYTGAMLNARLVNAYARYMRPLFNTFGQNVSDFVRQLDRLIETKIVEAYKSGDRELVEQLQLFQLQNTSYIDRFVDGKFVKGTGMSAQSFATLAGMFAMYQPERLQKAGINLSPWARAIATVASDARKLPGFTGFSSVVDLALGGIGTAAQALSKDNLAFSRQTGLQRAMSVYFGDNEALSKAVTTTMPGGLSFTGFVNACTKWMHDKSKEFSSDLLDTLKNGTPTTSAQMSETMARIISEAGVKEEDLSKFIGEVLVAAKESGLAEEGQKEALDKIVSIVKSSKDIEAGEHKAVEEAARAADLAREVEDLKRERDELNRKLAELVISKPSGPATTDTETKVSGIREALSTLDDRIATKQDESTNARSATAEAVDKVKTVRASIAGGETDAASLLFSQNHVQRIAPTTAKRKNRRPGGNVLSVNDNMTLAEQDDILSIFGEDGSLDRLSGIGGTIVDASGISAKDARRLCNVVAVALESMRVPVNREEADKIIRTMFPMMPESDVSFVQDQFGRLNDIVVQSGKSWKDMLDEESQDGADDDTGVDRSNQFNRTAVSDFNSPELKTFLTLAQMASPETGRNFQAFAVNLREIVGQLVFENDRLPEDKRDHKVTRALKFLEQVMNPRANVNGKTFNERQAIHTATMSVFSRKDKPGRTKVRDVIRTLLSASVSGNPLTSKGAMFLSYLMSLEDGDRERFTQLIANSAVCTAVRTEEMSDHKFKGMEEKPMAHYNVSEETVASTFRTLVGKNQVEIASVREKLKEIERNLKDQKVTLSDVRKGGVGLYRKMLYVADEIVRPLFGVDSPLYSALTSRSLQRYLKTASAKDTANVVDKICVSLSIVPTDRFGSSRCQILQAIDSVLEILQIRGSSKVEDVTSAAVVVFGSGYVGTSKLETTNTQPDGSIGISSLMSYYEDSLPATIMTAEVDENRRSERHDPSIAIASRGVVPLVSRWIDNNETGFEKIIRDNPSVFGIDKIDDIKLDKLLGVCRQNMTWPDENRTPIVAKCVSVSYRANEILTSCGTGYNEGKGPFYVPVYAGDHSTSILIQVPRSLAKYFESKFKGELKIDVKDHTEGWVKAYEDYLKIGQAVCQSLGLDLLGSDTKRSAVSSLEAPGVSMIGVETDADGNVVHRGKCRIAIAFNCHPDASNEEGLGTTYTRGYGAERLRAVAKDGESDTHKFHAIVTGGRTVEFLKALSVSTQDGTGRPSELSAARVFEDFADKVNGNDDLSTCIVTDFDSYKVGAANMKTIFFTRTAADGSVVPAFTDEDGNPLTVMQTIFKELKDKAANGKEYDRLTAEEIVNELLGGAEGLKIKDTIGGTEADVFDEKDGLLSILNGIEIRKIDGLNGTAYALVYEQNNLSGFPVANVSHEAEAPKDPGRTPSNHVCDAMSFVNTLATAGCGTNMESYGNLMNLMANWGTAAAAINTAPETIYNLYRNSLLRDADTGSIAALRAAGEHQAGQFILGEVARTVYAKLRKTANIPLNAVECPLVSNQASYDEKTGKVFCHSKSPMIRDTVQGPQWFSREEAEFYGAKHRYGIANGNIRAPGVRYGWYLDKATAVKILSNKAIGLLTGPEASDKDIALALEGAFTELNLKLERYKAARGNEDGGQAQYDEYIRYKRYVVGCFMDHHGLAISRKGDDFIANVSFDDLLRPKAGGGYAFDRTSIRWDERDQMHMDARPGEKFIYLGGTLGGLPRTPSYNTAWLQNFRLGLPLDEIPVLDETGNVVDWDVGRNAKIAPDPLTNKIEGCDHDGDKAKVYFLNSENGFSSFWNLPSFDPSASTLEEYRDELVNSESDGEAMVKLDGKTGAYRFTPKARARASNVFVRGIFDMSFDLDGLVETPEEANRGGERLKYTGLQLSDPEGNRQSNNFTKADPLGADSATDFETSMLDRLLSDSSIVGKPIMKGHTLAELDPACKVTDAANDANNARANGVAYSRTFGFAWASGMYTDTLFKGLKTSVKRRLGDGVDEKSDEYKKEFALAWMRFCYRIDGIANATFDDIKNQKCGRLGWTAGMLKTLMVDLIDGDIPTTDEDFYQKLRTFSKDIHDKGYRYWQLLSSEPTSKYDNRDANGKLLGKKLFREELERTFRNGKHGNVSKDDLMQYFGITEVVLDNGVAYELAKFKDGEKIPAGHELAKAVVAFAKTEDAKGTSVSDLLKVLVSSESDLLGRTYWIVKEFAKDKESVGKNVKAFAEWKRQYSEFTSAEAFIKSYFYTKANPGDNAESGTRYERTVENWESSSAKLETNGATHSYADQNGTQRSISAQSVLERMNLANRMMHEIGFGLETLAARGIRAAVSSTDNLTEMMKSRSFGLADLSAKLMTLDRVSKHDYMTLEANQQQIPYILSGLLSVGTDTGLNGLGRNVDGKLVSSPLDSGEKMYEFLKTLAEINPKIIKNSDGTETVIDKTGIMLMRRRIESIYDIMSQLAVSSEDSYFNTSFLHLLMKSDKAFDASGLRSLRGTMIGGTEEAQRRLRSETEAVIAGKAFSGERKHRFKRTKNPAKSFDVTIDNIDAYETEVTDNSGKAAAFNIRQKLNDAKAAIEALKKVTGSECITPSMMFGQILPMYTLLTTRVTGTPQAGQATLLSMLPKRIYESLSSGQVSLDERAKKVIDEMVSRNWAPLAKGAAAFEYSDASPEIQDVRKSLSAGGMLTDTEVEDLRKAQVGDGREARKNPEHRHVFDLFAGNGAVLTAIQELGGIGTVIENSVHDSPGRLLSGLGSGDSSKAVGKTLPVDTKVQKIAAAMQALLGSWAKIEYTGGTTFTIRAEGGRMKGDIGQTMNPVIVVDVPLDGIQSSDEQVRNLANSRAFAASLCAKVNLGMTAEVFMQLPESVRIAAAKRWGVGGATSNHVMWSMNGKGIATLVGNIVLDRNAAESTVYHEYFHAMTAMFRTMGVWNESDIAALRKTFGDPPAGKDMLFNEEKAAEAFRKYVIGEAKPAEDVRTVFQKIYDFLKGFLEALRHGFDYGKDGFNTDVTLFNMFIHGIAQRSTSALDGTVGDADLAVSIRKDLDRYEESLGAYERSDMKQTEMIGEARADVANSLSEVDETADSMIFIGKEIDAANPELYTEWTDYARALESAINGGMSLDTLADFGKQLDSTRRKMAAEKGYDLGSMRPDTSGTEANLDVAPLGTDAYHSELVRAAVSGATLPGVQTSPSLTVAKAITDACCAGLKTDGSWTGTLNDAIESYKAGCKGELYAGVNKATILNGIRMVIRQVNPKALKGLKTKDIENSLAFEAALSCYQNLESSFVSQDKFGGGLEQYLKAMSPEAAKRAERKAHATPYDIAGWCLTAHGVQPIEQVDACIKKLRDLRKDAPSGAIAEFDFLLGQIGRLRNVVDSSAKMYSFVADGGAAEILDSIIPLVTSGLNKPEFDRSGNLMDYEFLGESGNKMSDMNRDRLAMCQDPTDKTKLSRCVQEALKTTIPTLYAVASQVKFYRETGITPGSVNDLDAVRMMRKTNVPEPQSPAEWMANQAIGPSNLLDNYGLIELYDQPFFIANDMDRWLDSHLSGSFGNQSLVDTVLGAEHEFSGLAFEAQNEKNLLDMLLGANTETGGRILKVVDVNEDFAMKFGVVKHLKKGKTVKGFDAYHRETCDVALDELGLSAVQLYKDALLKLATGQKYLLTSADKIRFTLHDFEVRGDTGFRPESYTRKIIAERIAKHQNLTRFEEALARMAGIDERGDNGKGQLDDNILGKGKGQLDYYDRFVEAVCSAARDARDLRSDVLMDPGSMEAREYRTQRENALRNGWARFRKDNGDAPITRRLPKDAKKSERNRVNYDKMLWRKKGAEDARKYAASELFNVSILRELEKKGFVACTCDDTGAPKSATVKVAVSDIISMFKESNAYKTLTSEEGGRNYTVTLKDGSEVHCLDPKALTEPLMDVWRRTCTFVKQHPWITEGDAKYLNMFDTSIPFFGGSGYYVYHALRRERGSKLTREMKLPQYTQNWKRFLGYKRRDMKLSDCDKNELSATLAFLHDLYRTKEDEGALLNAIVEGRYVPGMAASYDTGLSLDTDATVGDLQDAIYQGLLEKAYDETVGTAETKVGLEVKDMIEAYNESRAGDASLVQHGIGMTDEAVYRSSGILPANFDLGHAVKNAIDQVTNAIMQRNTIVSLLLTPSSDGAPVYYADPSDLRAEACSVPDQVWGALARWWSDFNGLGAEGYDEKLSGVANAKKIYALLAKDLAKNGKTTITANRGTPRESVHRYTVLPPGDSDLVSIQGWLVQDDEELGRDSSLINAIGGGEAMGYLRQVVGAGRVLGIGGSAVRAQLHRALSWSKSLSVSFSFFFPLATKWESPIGAVGAMATLGSNTQLGAEFLRNHPDIMNGLTKMFPGSGWITSDFIGFKDIVKMMDSHSPFMAEMRSWAAALGISLSTNDVNPMEPTKAIVTKDIAKLKEAVRRGMGAEAAAKFGRIMDAMFTRQGEKAFTYALNATKLAVVAQMCMKLRHEAAKKGRAFDPVRDLRKYSRYMNAEVGGIDQKQYAWAHPMFRSIMNCLFFSWEWTRGAWEAGGGGILEDLLYGGHTFTKEERKYILGRWARMYGEVMIGVPAMMQILTKALALGIDSLAGGGDSGDDTPWWTAQNEDKTKWTAFDLTPLLRAIEKFDRVRLDSALRSFKENGALGTALVGGAIGAFKGMTNGGNLLTGAIAGAAGAGVGSLVPSLVPMYTGEDQNNQTTRNRHYYMHFGKQGWEFFRWFEAPGNQFFSKLSMPAQRMLEGFVGRNMSYLDKELPWEDMGALERWVNPTTDGALFNLAKAFIPFSVNGIGTFGDSGFLPIFGPVQMGASRTNIVDRLEKAFARWANNDRKGYRFGLKRSSRREIALYPLVSDIVRDARINWSTDPKSLKALQTMVATAAGKVISNKYGELFRELPKNPGDDFDTKKVEKILRSINRLCTKKRDILQSVKKKLQTQGRDWKSVLSKDQRDMYLELIRAGMSNPYGGRLRYVQPPDDEPYKTDY